MPKKLVVSVKYTIIFALILVVLVGCSSVQTKMYENKKFSYSIKVPIAWGLNETLVEDTLLSDPSRKAFAEIRIEPTEFTDKQDFFREVAHTLDQSYKLMYITTNPDRIKASYVYNDRGLSLIANQLVILHDKKVYQVYCSYQFVDAKLYKDLCSKVLDSFQIN